MQTNWEDSPSYFKQSLYEADLELTPKKIFWAKIGIAFVLFLFLLTALAH